MLSYLAVCAVATLSGYGILACLRLQKRLPHALLASPGVGLGLAATFLVSGVSAGAAFLPWVRCLLLAYGALAAVGLVSMVRDRQARSDAGPFLIALACPVAVLAPFFWWGIDRYPGSWFWDGWNYIALGQYLLDGPDKVNLAAPFYVHADALAHERFAASALIALLATALRGANSFSGYGVFLGLGLFVFAASSAFAAVFTLKSRWYGSVAAAISGTGLWMVDLVTANNLDNLAMLALVPLLFGLALWLERKDLWGGILLGIVLAALVCIQVELSLVAVIPVAVVLFQRIRTADEPATAWLRVLAVAVGSAALLAAPWLPRALEFAIRQFWTSQIAASAAPRPGEGYFPGFFVARCADATFWGLLAPFEKCGSGNVLKGLVGGGFTILAIIGALSARNLAAHAVRAALLLSGCSLFMAAVQHYDYGAYKFLAVAWFFWAVVLVVGARRLAERLGIRLSIRPALVGTTAALLLLAPQGVLLAMQVKESDASTPVKNIAYFLDLQRLPADEPDVVLNVRDPLALEWALYALRDRPITALAFNHPYLTKLRGDQQIPPGHLVEYVTDRVADEKCLQASMSAIGPYRWARLPLENLAVVDSIANANGVEDWGFWVGGSSEARIFIDALKEGTAVVSADFVAGPSFPETRKRRLLLASEIEEKLLAIDEGRQSLEISIPKGRSVVRMRALDAPTLGRQDNGDLRPLVLGVGGLAVCGR